MQPGVCTQRWTSSVQAPHRQLAQLSEPAHVRQPSSKEPPVVLGLQLGSPSVGGLALDCASVCSPRAPPAPSRAVAGSTAAVSRASVSAADVRASAGGVDAGGVGEATLAVAPLAPSDGASPEPQATAPEIARSSSCAPSWRGETRRSCRARPLSAPGTRARSAPETPALSAPGTRARSAPERGSALTPACEPTGEEAALPE
jgi:hypothetical protein